MIVDYKKLQLKVFPTGELETNAYLVFDEQTKDGFLVDCPAPVDEYRDFIEENNLNLKFIFTKRDFITIITKNRLLFY